MNLQKNQLTDILQIALHLADNISDIKLMLEKINVLAEDISADCFEKINLKTERGRFTAEYDINILRLKCGMLLEYILPATEISNELVTSSNKIVNLIKEKS